jgi:RNA polymerase sigma factor (sigma-70 family)
MSERVGWIAAEAEKIGRIGNFELLRGRTNTKKRVPIDELQAHAFPGRKVTPAVADESMRGDLHEQGSKNQISHPVAQNATRVGQPASEWGSQSYYIQDERRIYRSRTVAMLRRYMQYSIETGRLPSLLGREFFRSKVTSYRVTTFEDRVIFVHDMETCLRKLDDLSREVLARVVLQEYGHEEAARLLGCTRMTVHRRLVEALDELSEILLDVGLLARLCSNDGENESCQADKEVDLLLSDCESGE